MATFKYTNYIVPVTYLGHGVDLIVDPDDSYEVDELERVVNALSGVFDTVFLLYKKTSKEVFLVKPEFLGLGEDADEREALNAARKSGIEDVYDAVKLYNVYFTVTAYHTDYKNVEISGLAIFDHRYNFNILWHKMFVPIIAIS